MEKDTGEEKRWNSAKTREEYALRLKNLAEFKGLDVRQIMAGYLVGLILDDDMNPFYGIEMAGYTPKRGQIAKDDILECISWELEFGFTPKDIKERLEEVKEEIGKIDFTVEENYQKGRGIWERKVYRFVKNQGEKFRDSRDQIRLLELSLYSE